MKAQQDETLHETLERLRLEVAALRASRERLVLSADADRRAIERELHEGVQQHLIALAVNLQLAESADDPAAARALVEQMRGDVGEALDDAARLAQRIYPPLLDGGGLAATLRAAAASAGIRASVNISSDARFAPEVSRTIYVCWVELLTAGPASITVKEEDGALAFEIVAGGFPADSVLDRLRDRVEALGGRLTFTGTRVTGSLPVSR